MRCTSLPFIIMIILTSSFMSAQGLEDYQWKNRILILVDTAIDTEALQSQLQIFKEEEEALLDRDLIIFLLAEDTVFDAGLKPSEMHAENLRKRLGIPISFKGILLVGKDGGVKMKEEFKVEPEAVFSRIDGMPMRRAEMRKSGKL